ncbi:MAG: hypothetical protein EXR57_05740 [Dehalococcoidia bacterium]|nr:hypothetical protein [Dehalococcoidia bacterium]MSQ35300.1 hypothetical protein [Dehalococcoidia bacterium]
MKWTVFATAPDQMTAEMWVELLRHDGIRCEIRPGDTSRFMGVGTLPVRLVAPEDQAATAKTALDLLLQNTGADDSGE